VHLVWIRGILENRNLKNYFNSLTGYPAVKIFNIPDMENVRITGAPYLEGMTKFSLFNEGFSLAGIHK